MVQVDGISPGGEEHQRAYQLQSSAGVSHSYRANVQRKGLSLEVPTFEPFAKRPVDFSASLPAGEVRSLSEKVGRFVFPKN